MNEQEKNEYISYIHNIRNSSRTNYYKESLKEIEQFKKKNPDRKPTILLHACCIVCACWPLEFLYDSGFDITIMYNNSNIYPEEEYEHRLSEMKRYLRERWNDSIPLIVTPYQYKEYEGTVLKNREMDPEGWKSCFACYANRMNEAFAYADANDFDWFTTVMTFSRQKNSAKINEIGTELSHKYNHTKYFLSDFKKANGALASDSICTQYDIYRQDYCGCRFSMNERHGSK
jgi:predicted adenine nucleotide alpha hydrolase (AANH) superfamily ATPase